MDIPKTKGYTCFVKIAECALEGDIVKAKHYVKKFIIMYPESDLIYPFQHLLNGIKNPDGLTLDQIIPLPNDDIVIAYGEGYQKGCEDTIMERYGITKSEIEDIVKRYKSVK